MPSNPPGSPCPYDEVRREATLMAGGIHDLAQRAGVYHHLFVHSGRNHVFPLLAAHGALWARGHFQKGMRLGWPEVEHAMRDYRIMPERFFEDSVAWLAEVREALGFARRCAPAPP
ncbi:hypothetical protein GCM10009416_42150 [Craurococcus roseus]|uniref:Uncharacterized protein n=1 Tax=Craurococcus roseus TaxID=77585 RepID=A0ABP3R106_9PROT